MEIKSGVVELFPDAEKLDRVAVLHPILDDIIAPFFISVPGTIYLEEGYEPRITGRIA